MARVILKKQAFISTVTACLEVYKKESFGLLLGKHKRGTYTVEQAIAYQSTTRDYDYVSFDAKAERRTNNALQFLSRDSLIGDYHSHPDFPDHLSKHDKSELLLAPPEYLAMLVLVKKSDTYKMWRRNADKSLSGTIGLTRFLKIHAYRVSPKTGRIEALPITCEYLAKINQYLKEYRKSREKLEKLERAHKLTQKQKQKIRARLKKYFN